jgi:hypothetical protein
MTTLARIPLLGAAALAAMVALGTTTACGGPATSVTQVWKAPVTPTVPMRSLIVFGTNMSEANRRVVEDTFAASLNQRGVHGVQSYRFFQGELPTREQARDATRAAGIDGILVMSLQGVREKHTYVPGFYSGDFWGGYYGTGWGSYTPGYVATDEIVHLETTLWDPRARDALVWSAVTETTNPDSGSDFATSVAKKVVPEMERAHFLPPKS